MKRTIKAFILALYAFMLIGMSAQAKQDTAGTVDLLTNLNIITSEDKSADGITTRAEFIKYAVGITGNKAVYSYDKPVFTDVAKSHWAYEEICSAYALGLIKPDNNGRLNPDSPIKAADAARILLNAAGYGEYIKNRNDVDVISIAANKEIFDNVSLDGDTPLSKDAIFQMLFNTLHADLVYVSGMSGNNPQYSVVEGKTLLSDRFDVEYVEGVVIADDRMAISGKKAAKNSIIIGNTNYNISSIKDSEDFLGSTVRCYYKDYDGTNEIVCIYSKKTVYAEFGFEDAYYKNNQFGQYVGNKLYDYETNSKTTVFINGCLIKNTSVIGDSFDNYCGSVKMIDNNNDGIYDIVIIERYINAIIESYNAIDEILKTKDNTYEFNKFAAVYVENMYREELKDYNFKVDTLVSIFAPPQGNDMLVIVKGDVKEGTITEFSNNSQTSFVTTEDEMVYKLSKPYLGKLTDIVTGELYELYIDFNGYLAYTVKKVNKALLGYMAAAYKSDSGDDMMFRIFTATGNMETMKAGKSLAIRLSDGTVDVCKNADVIYTKLSAENSLSAVPVMYRKNSKDEIIKLFLLTSDQTKEFHILTDDKVTITNDRYEYRNSSFSGKYVCRPSTLFMTVPMNSGNISDYKITSVSNFTSGSAYRFGTSYYKRNSAINIAVEPDGFLTDFFIYKVDTNEQKVIKGTTLPVIIKKILKAANSDNEEIISLTVVSYDGKETVYEISDCTSKLVDNAGRELGCGDIIRIDVDEYGKVSSRTIDLLYDCDSETHIRYLGDDTNRILTFMRLVPVTVLARDEDYIQINTISGIDPENKAKASKEITKISSAKVFVYNKSKQLLEVSDTERVAKNDKFVAYMYYENIRMIVYYED